MPETRERKIAPPALGLAVWQLVERAAAGGHELHMVPGDAVALVEYVEHLRSWVNAPAVADAALRATPAGDAGEVRERVVQALKPFATIGAWLFARDLPDDTPVVEIEMLGGTDALTRGHFKAAHVALESLLSGSGTPPGEGEAETEPWLRKVTEGDRLQAAFSEGWILRGLHDADGVLEDLFNETWPRSSTAASLARRESAALRSAPSGVEEGEPDESEVPVRCTCDWDSPESGAVDPCWPYVLDPHCRLHGAPGGNPEPCRCVPVEGEPAAREGEGAILNAAWTAALQHEDVRLGAHDNDLVTLNIVVMAGEARAFIRECAARLRGEGGAS